MNKKAYLKTIEAIIAVVIILIFIFTVIPRERVPEASVPKNIEILQETITNEIENNEEYRQEIINNDGVKSDFGSDSHRPPGIRQAGYTRDRSKCGHSLQTRGSVPFYAV